MASQSGQGRWRFEDGNSYRISTYLGTNLVERIDETYPGYAGPNSYFGFYGSLFDSVFFVPVSGTLGPIGLDSLSYRPAVPELSAPLAPLAGLFVGILLAALSPRRP